MKEINIARTVVNKRREKGITQDDLANYIGVSKASVSKWETGQSYPDIVFLPQLAAYFNISLDELMGYEPQLTRMDIEKLYRSLTARFAEAPFAEALAECRGAVKKYYSCFPLLMQMAILLVNHHMLAETPEEKEAILREAAELCIRVQQESGDARLSKEAFQMQAFCCLALNEPQSVLDLLGESVNLIHSEEMLIAQAYQQMGNTAKAREILQVSMYQYLMLMFSAMLNSLGLCADDSQKADEIINRALSVAKVFEMEKLNPNMAIQLYATAAKIYCANGFIEKAVDMLNRSVDVFIEKLFPLTLHGDEFFNSIDGWLADLDLGTVPPRNEKVVKESMMRDVLLNPAYAALAEKPGYQNAVQKLEKFIGGN